MSRVTACLLECWCTCAWICEMKFVCGCAYVDVSIGEECKNNSEAERKIKIEAKKRKVGEDGIMTF